MFDVAAVDQHQRADRRRSSFAAVADERLLLGLEQPRAIEQLRVLVGPIVLAPNDHRRLDEPVSDGRRERVAEDDRHAFLDELLLVGRRRQADHRQRVEIADRL